VTLALVHGGQPDALVICHEPTRDHMRGLPGYKLPSLVEVRDMALALARVANPACVAVGVSINTQHMSEADARAGLLRRPRLRWACPRPTRSVLARGCWWTR
jgi:uncharacterized NAD-dependent epimerase/dehydratase family protein